MADEEVVTEPAEVVEEGTGEPAAEEAVEGEVAAEEAAPEGEVPAEEPAAVAGAFRDLWNGLPAVQTRVALGMGAFKEQGAFLKGVTELTLNYAKGLGKLCADQSGGGGGFFGGGGAGNSNKQGGTSEAAWKQLIQGIQSVSGTFLKIAEEMNTSVVQSMHKELVEIDKLVKTTTAEVQKVTTEEKKSNEMLAKAKKGYEVASKELEAAIKEKKELEKKGKDASKVVAKIKQAEAKQKKEEEVYKKAITDNNGLHEGYYGEHLPKVLDDLQAIEVRRMEQCRVAAESYINGLLSAPDELKAALDSSLGVIQAVSTDDDVRTFSAENAPAEPLPGPLEFVEIKTSADEA